MKRIANRGLALLMAVLLCFSLLSVTATPAQAASNWVYNWGTRGQIATELSESAEAFYTGNNTYANLSQLPGGTSQSDAPSSALYSALKTLMTQKHTYVTSYEDTRNMFAYTDCQNGGSPSTISSFYSGKPIGPAWDAGATWNREHTWPNSKGSGDGENDIMMLRPTSVTENSSRGNTAYGESSGYYNPNGASNGNYDLRGDVARIMLYVYTRWGNTGAMWGNGKNSGVIESQDVLLKWMEQDPVDTWELGRNDSVQSITGTRNVFVDYPELAFKLFGESVPTTMSTPSNGQTPTGHVHSYGTGVVTAPTCTAQGYTTFTCSDTTCQYSFKTDYTDKVGHNFADGVCTVCGAAETTGGDSTGDSINGSVTFSVADHAAANNWTNETKYESIRLNGVVTATASGTENTGKYYSSSNQWRIYQSDSGTLTISVEGTTISSVKITYVKQNTGVLTYNGVNVDSGEIVNVNASSITFGVSKTGTDDKINGQARITAIEVAYGTGSIGGDDNTGDGGNTGEGGGNTGGTVVETKTVKIYYPGDQKYATSATADKNRLAGVSSEEEATVWTVEIDENGYYIFSSEGKYMTSGATGNSLYMADALTDCARWEVIECTGGVYLRNVGAAYNGEHNQYMEFYYDFTTYGFRENNAGIYTFQLVEVAVADPNGYTGLRLDTDGMWRYYTNGEVNTAFAGLVDYYGNKFYVANGVLDTAFAGLVEHQGSTYYVAAGAPASGYTGLILVGENWYYVISGVVAKTFTGLIPAGGNLFYIANGVLNTEFIGLVEYEGSKYYVACGAAALSYTGLTMVGETWYYVIGGAVAEFYTGLTTAGGNLFYLVNGVLDTSYVGLVTHAGVRYFVYNGIVAFNFSGLVLADAGWTYVSNGTVAEDYTGLVVYGSAEYYIANGVVDWSFSGTVDGKEVVNGVVAR